MYYGLTSEDELRAHIRRVCDVVNPGNARFAIKLLNETACPETDYGHARDGFFAQGKGWAQFDSIGYIDVIQRMPEKYPEIWSDVARDLGFPLSKVPFDGLDFSPLASAYFCRCKYYLVPHVIPDKLEGRADYWKRWYNSSKGAGTPEKYIAAVKRRFGENYS